jgi:hypothetical protein
MYGLPRFRKPFVTLVAATRLRQCIRPVGGAQRYLALMESARIDPHKAFGYENRFFSQAGNAPENGCAIR